MFDIGWSELLVVGIVALIVIGPKELPGVLRMTGQWIGRVRRMAADFQGQFQEAMREAEMADLKKQVDEITQQADDLTASFDPLDHVRNEIDDVNKSIEDASRATEAAAAERPDPADVDAYAQAGSGLDPGAIVDAESFPAEPQQAAPQPAEEIRRASVDDERDADRPARKTVAGGVAS